MPETEPSRDLDHGEQSDPPAESPSEGDPGPPEMEYFEKGQVVDADKR